MIGKIFKSVFRREYPGVDYEEILNDDRTLMSTQIMLECMSRGKIPKNVLNREEYIERAKAIVFDREYMNMRRHNNGGRYVEQEEEELQEYLKEKGVKSIRELESKNKRKRYERKDKYKVEDKVPNVIEEEYDFDDFAEFLGEPVNEVPPSMETECNRRYQSVFEDEDDYVEEIEDLRDIF